MARPLEWPHHDPLIGLPTIKRETLRGEKLMRRCVKSGAEYPKEMVAREAGGASGLSDAHRLTHSREKKVAASKHTANELFARGSTHRCEMRGGLFRTRQLTDEGVRDPKNRFFSCGA